MNTLFKPDPNIKARIDVVGREEARILVIDDFACDAEALIDIAKAAFDISAGSRSYFPGRIARVPKSFAFSMFEFLAPAIETTFGLKGPVDDGSCDFQILTLSPDELSVRQRVPHFDSPDPNVVASVHYLCGDRFKGTNFYRHRSTGYESLSSDRIQHYEMVLKEELTRFPPCGYIDGDTPLFERIAGYEAVFNRIILFRGSSLHCAVADPAHGFDPTPRLGRLTANLFLHFVA
jgi:hypothetical protein